MWVHKEVIEMLREEKRRRDAGGWGVGVEATVGEGEGYIKCCFSSSEKKA